MANEFLQLIDRFKETFALAAKERPARQTRVKTTDWKGRPDEEIGWVVFEREVMHKLVNEIRVKRGLSEIGISEVQKVETWACGHVDYAQKYAIYCAELALGKNAPVP
jgi:hypothetical protein